MSKRHREENTTIGEDSFLDTIANLVGILIIFIVIAGTGTRTKAVSIAKQQLDEANKENVQASEVASQLQEDLGRKAKELTQYAMELEFRKAERDAMLDRINAAKLDIESRLSQMDESQQKDALLQSESAQLKSEVEARLKAL